MQWNSSIPDAMGPKMFLLIRKVSSVQELIDTKKVCLSIFKRPGHITSGVGNSQCSIYHSILRPILDSMQHQHTCLLRSMKDFQAWSKSASIRVQVGTLFAYSRFAYSHFASLEQKVAFRLLLKKVWCMNQLPTMQCLSQGLMSTLVVSGHWLHRAKISSWQRMGKERIGWSYLQCLSSILWHYIFHSAFIIKHYIELLERSFFFLRVGEMSLFGFKV